MSEATEILEKHIKSLPPKFREAIANVEMRKPLEEIHQKYGLMLDQVSALEAETVMVAVGLESGDDFVDNIIKNVGVKEVDAIAIAKEINTKIFEEIKRAIQTEENKPETPDENESEDDILSAIEKPNPVGSRIRTSQNNESSPTPSTKQASAPDNLPTESPEEVAPKMADAATEEMPDKQDSPPLNEIPVDPALAKLQGKGTSFNEKEEVGETTSAEDKKYPGGADPYREPVE